MITVKLVMNRKCHLFRLLNQDFSYFEVEKFSNEPDITINIGNFIPSNSDCHTVDHRYYIKENYLYCKDQQNKVKWEVEIDGFEKGNTVVNFNFKYSDLRKSLCLPIYVFLLEGLLFSKLLEKGYSLIHAAGVSKDGKAYLFAGRGGAHKSTLVMHYLKNGFKYLGDDKVIIHNNEVFAYPLNFQKFDYLYNNLEVGHDENVFDKLKYVKNNLSTKKINTSIVADKSKIKKLFFVVKKKQNHIKINNVDKEDALKKLELSNILELSIHGSHMPKITGLKKNPFYRYILTYNYIYPDNNLTHYGQNLANQLSGIIDTCYELEMPDVYNSEILEVIDGML